MKAIAATGVFVLIPCAITLDRLDFGATFAFVQAVELLGGALNLTLLGPNFRDGLVERRPDPDDGRRARIHLTERAADSSRSSRPPGTT